MTAKAHGHWALPAYVALMTVVILLPIAVVLLTSLTSDAFIAFPPRGLSLKWYAAVLASSTWVDSLKLSLVIGTMVTVFALLCGVPAALALRAREGWVSVALQTFFMSPLMLPTIIIGLAVLQFYQSISARPSAVTVAAGQALIAMPYVIRLVLGSLSGLDPNLERAACILGANPWTTFRRVTFPLIRQGIVAGALFSFIVSLDDVNIALFLSDIHTTPLPVQLFSYIEQNADPLGAAVASLLVLLALALIVVCDRIVGIEWLFGIKQAHR